MSEMDNTNGYWVLVRRSQVHLIEGQLPYGSAEYCGFSNRKAIHIGNYVPYDGVDNQKQTAPMWLVQANDSDEGKPFYDLRSQLLVEESLRNFLHRAVSLNHFFNTHRYCGRCGTEFELAGDEVALSCLACDNRIYPTISPCIIVAIRRGRHLLLANHHRSNPSSHAKSSNSEPSLTSEEKPRMYTTLAGFVEAGENLENTVIREVWEESKIKIKNVRYFGSQSWSFPNTLMLGFLADYDEGEINIQEDELADAQWFDCDSPLPKTPVEGTIALQLINATLDLCRAEVES